MGFYARHIGPRFVSCLCSMEAIAAERERVVPQASGVVLEIGIGPGLNLSFYDPARVTRVIGVDPIAEFLELGRERRRSSPVPVEIVQAPAEALPLADASIDTAVITYTLCSVEDPVQALREAAPDRVEPALPECHARIARQAMLQEQHPPARLQHAPHLAQG